MSWRESQSHSSSLPSREQAKQPEANIESKPPTHLMGPGGTELLDVVHGNSTVINAISPLDPQHGKEPLQQHLRSPPGVFPVHSNKSYDFSYQTSGNYQPEHHLEPPRHPGEYVPPFYPQYAINHPEEPAHYSEQEPWNLYAQATQVLEQPDTQPVTSSAGSSNPLEEHSRPQAFIQTEVDGRRRYNCTWEGCAKEFSELSKFKLHHVSHTEVKPYPCKYCPQAFLRHRELAMHFQTKHMLQKEHRCTDCADTFTRPDSLRRHRRICRARKGEAKEGQGSHSSTNE